MLALYVVSDISKTGKDSQFLKISSNCSEKTVIKLLYEERPYFVLEYSKLAFKTFVQYWPR